MTGSKATIAPTQAFAEFSTESGNVSRDERPTQARASKALKADEGGTRHLPPSVGHPKPSGEPLRRQFQR